ncbi:TetR/AcrR family transcriptional regulator [Haliea sp. AH-315-K21]|uniref:TetR family transcriptional regulator n=1 Tax=SAR86 cluster bacterium TaxID=2030880 RepID=A0A2A5CGA7_9GAMM|nr:TetR/AcrR family transcriptional regulator [Haliea sp. AH-315-K21]MBN4059882.1 TetR/AcrR family transcriptional regulator [bacterium AH-315-I11]PCJ42897.1 MAG: TetR family transcriptional regulator [SAR86 cluster bacterium]
MIGQRGRPKLYESEAALKAAGTVFWAKGFSGTSLDDLSAAMGMNRPSIYRAFGDKEEIYRQALNQFGTIMDKAFKRTLVQEKDIRKGLKKFYREALDVYSSEEMALGCMVWSTAPAATLIHPEVQSDLMAAINHVDAMILQRVELAIEQGQVHKDVDAKSLSKLIQALLHSISIRVRAGESTKVLRRFIDSAIVILLGEK